MTRLHVKGACGGLELGLVEAVLKGLCAQIKVTMPSYGLLLGRLAAKVSPQRVLVLAKDAWHKDLRIRKRDVGECLARFGKQVRLFDSERL